MPHAEPERLSDERVCGLRIHIVRTLLDSTPREEWDRYVLDTEPEVTSVLNAYRAERS
jgi:hypothetical protein